MRSKKLLYVAGKYSDPRGWYFVRQHIWLAERCTRDLALLGIAAHCPHLQTQHLDGLLTHEDFLALDFVVLEHCDGIVMLENWGMSEGARREHTFAALHDMDIFYWPKDREKIKEWAYGEILARPEDSFYEQTDDYLDTVVS